MYEPKKEQEPQAKPAEEQKEEHPVNQPTDLA
jgi:hypothetical protein